MKELSEKLPIEHYTAKVHEIEAMRYSGEADIENVFEFFKKYDLGYHIGKWKCIHNSLYIYFNYVKITWVISPGDYVVYIPKSNTIEVLSDDVLYILFKHTDD